MLGIVYRGQFDEFPENLINLKEAEQAYLRAARYAMADHKEHAGRAFCGALEAAYAGSVANAVAHVRRAIGLFPGCGEAHFVHAKYLFQMGGVPNGINALRKVIRLDGEYALKCFSFEEFTRSRTAIQNMITHERHEIRRACKEFHDRCRSALMALQDDTEAFLSDKSITLLVDDAAKKGSERVIRQIESVAKNDLPRVYNPTFVGGYLDALGAETRKFDVAVMWMIACAKLVHGLERLRLPLMPLPHTRGRVH
jgi:hypothetical protein